MKLRPATIHDIELLRSWRNDPLVRRMSITSHVISREEHSEWFYRALSNPARHIFIVENAGAPVGMVRADESEGSYELSWLVASGYRNKGIGTRMARILVSQLDKPVSARIKSFNLPSLRIAEHAGMRFVCNRNGLMHFESANRSA
jgi:RimJ/RimL family protein N-acetyltransferase